MNEKRRLILGLAIVSVAFMFCPRVRAEGAVFRDEVPHGFSGAEFPQVVSYLDRRGVLWVFWMEDSRLFYSNLTEMAQWDITTSYKDYMKGPELTTWISASGPASQLSIILVVTVLAVAGFALRRSHLSHRRSRKG